jgi:hypothetical protein
MAISLYNTLTRTVETFTPLEAGTMRMYVCGPTVYDFFHIGNARSFVMSDVVRRYFEYRGYAVTFVMNLTDVDDKIIRRANEQGVASSQIAETYAQAFLEDAARLGDPPRHRSPARDREHGRHHRAHRRTRRKRLGLRGRWRRVLPRGVVSELRPAQRQEGRRADRRCARRGRHAQGECRSTSRCGRPPSPASPRGPRPGATGVPAGTSSARSCRRSISATPSTSTAAATT